MSSKVVSCLRESKAERHREGGGASTAAPEEGANEQVGGGVLEPRWGTPCPPVLGLCLLSMWGVILGPAEFRFPRPAGGVIVTLRRLLQGLGTGLVGGALPMSCHRLVLCFRGVLPMQMPWWHPLLSSRRHLQRKAVVTDGLGQGLASMPCPPALETTW